MQVLEESFLDLIEKDGTIARSLEIVKENNIAEWGSDVSITDIWTVKTRRCKKISKEAVLKKINRT